MGQFKRFYEENVVHIFSWITLVLKKFMHMLAFGFYHWLCDDLIYLLLKSLS